MQGNQGMEETIIIEEAVIEIKIMTGVGHMKGRVETEEAVEV